jgi:hypothetical protein
MFPIFIFTQIDATQMINLRDTFLEEVEEVAEGRLSLTDIVISSHGKKY